MRCASGSSLEAYVFPCLAVLQKRGVSEAVRARYTNKGFFLNPPALEAYIFPCLGVLRKHGVSETVRV